MASARGKSRQRRGEFIKQQRRLGKGANVPIPRSFSGKIAKKKGDPDYPDRWDVRLGQGIANIVTGAGGNFKDTATDVKDKFTGWMSQGAKERFLGLPKAAIDAATRNAEEVEAAKRDDDEFTWGGDPIAVDKGSPAYQFLLNQMEDKDAFREAVKDDKVFYTGLEEMSGDKYDASHPGLIALLNDPSRLKDMAPIRALNYMRSITGDPSNMGFDEFEAWRQAEGRTEEEKGLTATEIAKKLLPQYQAAADEMYGDGFIADKAREYVDVNPAIMNYRDPIRNMVAPTATGQSMIPDLNPRIPYQDASAEDVSISGIKEYNKSIGIDPDPGWWSYPVGMDQRPNTTSHWLRGIYPNYTPNPILNEIEGMDEQELLDWGAQNPNEAKVLGFNPYYSNMWID